MRARIMPDTYSVMGAPIERVRATQPRDLPRFQTVRLELPLDRARKLRDVAKFHDDRLCAAAGAFRFIAFAAKSFEDPNSHDLRCIAELCAWGLEGQEREDNALWDLHAALTEMERAPADATPDQEDTDNAA